MKCTENEGQRLVAEFMAKLASGYRIACADDDARYPDGIESRIISDAGAARFYKEHPVAIAGGTTDNGDTIISSLQSSAQLQEYADDDRVPGLLRPDYRVSTRDLA